MTSPPPPEKLYGLRAIGWPRLCGIVAATTVAVALSLWVPWILGNAVDALTAGTLQGAALWRELALLLAVVLAGTFSSKLMRLLPMRLSPAISHELRKQVLGQLLRLDDAQMRTKRVGDLMTRLNSDIPAISDMIALGGHSLFRASLSLGLGFVMMFRGNVELAVLMLVLLPVLIAIGFVLLRGMQERHRDVQEQFSQISNFCQESFLGIRVIKGMGIEEHREAKFHALNQHYIGLNLHMARIEIPAWPLMHFGFVMGTVLLLAIGGRLVIRDELSLGTLVAFQQYLMVLQWPTLSLAWAISLVMRGRASRERILALLREVPQLVPGQTSLLDQPQTAVPFLHFEGLRLEADDRPLLRDINLRIAEGCTLGITGPSGSGKTLLCHLLLRRMDPSAGNIFLRGQNLQTLRDGELQRYIRLAPQEPLLFSTTLAENLRFGDPDASDERLRWALDIAGLLEEVEEWPEGLATQIGERGITLSGGQRQRCGIARALLGDPGILILDDCLAAVDTRTEANILQKLGPVMADRTSIIVSHRYSALRNCDRILVMQDGRITEDGTAEALRTSGGYFAELAERQRLQAQLEAMTP